MPHREGGSFAVLKHICLVESFVYIIALCDVGTLLERDTRAYHEGAHVAVLQQEPRL